MANIHKDPAYQESKSRLDDAIRAHAEFVNDWAAREVNEPRQNLIVIGWVMGIGVTWMGPDGDMFDDLLPETSERLMTFTRNGMSQALGDRFRYEDDYEEDEDD